jgi:hypothetical protein
MKLEAALRGGFFVFGGSFILRAVSYDTVGPIKMARAAPALGEPKRIRVCDASNDISRDLVPCGCFSLRSGHSIAINLSSSTLRPAVDSAPNTLFSCADPLSPKRPQPRGPKAGFRSSAESLFFQVLLTNAWLWRHSCCSVRVEFSLPDCCAGENRRISRLAAVPRESSRRQYRRARPGLCNTPSKGVRHLDYQRRLGEGL